MKMSKKKDTVKLLTAMDFFLGGEGGGERGEQKTVFLYVNTCNEMIRTIII